MKFSQVSVVDYFNRKNALRMTLFLGLSLPLLLIPGVKVFGFFILAVLGNLVFSFMTHPLRRASMGIELTTFLTVISALAFGPMWGVIFGIGLILAEYVGTMRISILAIATVPSVALIGLVVPLFSGVDLAVLGLVVTLLYNLITFSLCFSIRHRVMGLIVFAVTNIIWNKFLFSFASAFF